MELLYMQVLFGVLIVIGTVSAALIPILVLWRRSRCGSSESSLLSLSAQKWLSLASTYACGVFIAMIFLGLNPSAQSKWTEAVEGTWSLVPWHGLTLLIGFTVILSLEGLLKHDHGFPSKSLGSQEKQSMHRSSDDQFESDYVSLNAMSNFDTSRDDLLDSPTVDSTATVARFSNENARRKSVGQGCCDGLTQGVRQTTRSSKLMTLLCGVVTHNLLEGTTLGLQKDGGFAVLMFVGIALHAVIFTMAVTFSVMRIMLQESDAFLACAVVMVLVCLARPAGVVLGVIIANLPDQIGVVVTAVLMSLSTGVFTEITFVSLMPEEFNSYQISGLKVACLGLGWMTMVVVDTWMASFHPM